MDGVQYVYTVPVSPLALTRLIYTHRRITKHACERTRWRLADNFRGARISANEIRPFIFAPIALTDDAAEAVQDEAIIKGLGTIRLDFYRTIYQSKGAKETLHSRFETTGQLAWHDSAHILRPRADQILYVNSARRRKLQESHHESLYYVGGALG